MNQQEKIKAYLLNQLPPDELMSFRAEINNDPELMAEVKATKLLLIAKEMRNREVLQEKMKSWSETESASLPNNRTWIKRRGILLVLASMIVLLIGYYLTPPTQPVDLPSEVDDIISNNINKNPISTKIDTQSTNKTNVATQAFSIKKLRKFSNAILSIEIKNRSNVIKKGASQSRSQDSDIPGIGYIVAKEGHFYVITNAYAVRNAGLAMGDIIGVGTDLSQYALKLIGADNFYDIAVLSMEHLPLQAVRLSDEVASNGDKVYAFSGSLHKSSDSISIYGGKVDKNYGNFLRIGTSTWKTTDGPVINSDGAVVGMFSQYTDAIFPDELYRRYILSENIISKVIYEIIKQKSNPARCYSGIGFSTNDAGNVVIKNLIERSPAESETDLIGHEVRSINYTKINSLADVAEALRLVKPGDSFYMVSNLGSSRKIETKELTYLDLERIAANAIETTGTFQYESRLDNLIVNYLDEKLSKSDFIVLACQITPHSKWHNISSASDFGQILRHIGLVGQGIMKVYENVPSNKKNIPITYSKPILWN